MPFVNGKFILTESQTRIWDSVTNAETFTEMVKASEMKGLACFQGGDLTDIDMEDLDLDGWNLSGTKLDGTNMSLVQNIEKAIFDSETSFTGTILPAGMTPEMLII